MSETKEIALTTIGQALDNLGNSYQHFLCADNKRDKLEMLNNLRLAALDVSRISKEIADQLSEKLYGPAPGINNPRRQAVSATSINIHFQVMNLDQLYKRFLLDTPQDHVSLRAAIHEKIDYFYQMHCLSADIAEAALTTSAEPDKETERA